MSNEVNEKLLERARELVEETTGHPAKCDQMLVNAMDAGDLVEVQRLVGVIEGELAVAHFNDAEII